MALGKTLPSPAAVLPFLLMFAAGFCQENSWEEENAAGSRARQAGQYDEAEKHFVAAVHQAEGLGPTDSRLVSSLHALAFFYQERGRYVEEEPLLKRILELREGELGKEHPDLVPALLEVAACYRMRQRDDEAEPHLRRAIAIQEKTLGPTHPQTIQTLRQLAMAYLSEQKYTKADELYRTLLEIHQSRPDLDGREMAHDLIDLSAICTNRGKPEEAESFLRQALELSEERLGKLDPFTAGLAQRLGTTYSGQKRYAEAEPLLLQWLASEEKNNDSSHSNLTFCLNTLANFYRVLHREVEAESFQKRALEIRGKRATEEAATSPDKFQLINIGSDYMRQGKYVEAERAYQQALESMETSYGPDHPSITPALVSVALAFCAQARFDEAQQLYERAIRIAEKSAGPDSAAVAERLMDNSYCYRNGGDYARAEALYQRAINMLDKPGAPVQPALFRALSEYSGLLTKMGREADREKVKVRLDAVLARLRQGIPEL